ncbi:slit homolog 1 protein-like isoform X4 [Mytilus californianus]|uniref:slit homolog 1 protein-like isoform X2 n=1 Tax=Mytilus californianus TaxID=6549 RepID=UPI002245C905|nr:slit homolog 1 protein-like isoform X2 [Mytilus californianus]XP_052106636.1 slit homolog 1 protein-like isoform X3 [Mytilus californianus]XP_052106637.1 slit homolog 1 protein-like isoform X4 [Mytilus californianus]
MKMMFYNVAACLLVIAVSNDRVLSCPSICYCSTDINGVNVNCGNRGLTVIPRNFTNDSYTISLSGNNLTFVKNDTFEHNINLKYLYLYNNQITTIQQGAFQNLLALQTLYLYNNQITTIQQGAFQNLLALQTLDLSGNNLTFVKNDTFEHNINLQHLYLYNNKITTIQQGTFQNLSGLLEISMSGNNLTFVKNDTFEHNINLKYLDLDLVCDCNVPFWSWVKSQSFYEDFVTCLDRDNVILSSLQESDFDNCTYKSCYPDYCSNGGSCSQNSYVDLVCSCVGGWTGTTCTGKWNIHRIERL